jgi:nucleotide-binding universal stress UspA family protein
MRILCAIGIRRGVELVRRVSSFTRPGDELVLVHVLDVGPRHDLNHLEGTLRPHHLQHHELNEAEQEAGKATLQEATEEAKRIGVPVTTRLERGRPEQVIVELARDPTVGAVALLAREMPHGHPLQGPPSVGHTARFVVDHAPVDVLVFRERP